MESVEIVVNASVEREDTVYEAAADLTTDSVTFTADGLFIASCGLDPEAVKNGTILFLKVRGPCPPDVVTDLQEQLNLRLREMKE